MAFDKLSNIYIGALSYNTMNIEIHKILPDGTKGVTLIGPMSNRSPSLNTDGRGSVATSTGLIALTCTDSVVYFMDGDSSIRVITYVGDQSN